MCTKSALRSIAPLSHLVEVTAVFHLHPSLTNENLLPSFLLAPPPQWHTVRTLEIPNTANFQDYSAISVSWDGKVAVTSQEDSAMWVGRLNGIVDEDTITTTEELDFEGPGKVRGGRGANATSEGSEDSELPNASLYID